MRMIDTNIFNTDITMKMAHEMGAKKYFCVSTDKAANPVNMMGASKRIIDGQLIIIKDGVVYNAQGAVVE